MRTPASNDYDREKDVVKFSGDEPDAHPGREAEETLVYARSSCPSVWTQLQAPAPALAYHFVFLLQAWYQPPKILFARTVWPEEM